MRTPEGGYAPPLTNDEVFEIQQKQYFARLGMQFRKEFKILRDKIVLGDQAYPVFGKAAEQEGWFIGRRAVLQGVLALKIAELAHLSEKAKGLLVEASVTNGAMKRIQYATRDSSDISPEEFTSIQKGGLSTLIANGVNPRAAEISTAVGPVFGPNVVKGVLKPKTAEEAEVFMLQRYLHYLHNCTQQDITLSEKTVSGKEQRSYILDWSEHLRDADLRYAGGISKYRVENLVSPYKERVATYQQGNTRENLERNASNPKKVSNDPGLYYFEAEAMVMDETEQELKQRIQKENPNLKLGDTPLWTYLRNEMGKDIRKEKVRDSELV